MARVAAAAVVPAGGAAYVISSFGNTFSFRDRMLYDPMQMRSRKVGAGWVFAGAPSIYRDNLTKGMWRVKWFVQGEFLSASSNNRINIYVNQYRAGALLRAYICHIGNNATNQTFSGERTFYTHTASLSEDADWTTDDWQVEIANVGAHDYRADLNNVEMEFIPVQ